MKKILVLLIGVFLFTHLVAQDKADPRVLTHPVEVTPNPPGAVKGWTYIENWSTGNLSENEQEVSVLQGDYPGQIIKFPFSGKAVGIAVYSGTDSGMIEFSVDEADWQQLDLFSFPVGTEYTLRYFTLESQLKGQKHMLQLRVSANKNPNSKGHNCILRSFVINE